jgi:hypothetical protein
VAAQPGDPRRDRVGRLAAIDRLHQAARAIAGRRHLAVVEIDGEREVACARELGCDRLDLVVQAPPFVDQQDGRCRRLGGQGERRVHLLAALGGQAHVLEPLGGGAGELGIGEHRGQ